MLSTNRQRQRHSFPSQNGNFPASAFCLPSDHFRWKTLSHYPAPTDDYTGDTKEFDASQQLGGPGVLSLCEPVKGDEHQLFRKGRRREDPASHATVPQMTKNVCVCFQSTDYPLQTPSTDLRVLRHNLLKCWKATLAAPVRYSVTRKTTVSSLEIRKMLAA